MSVDSGLTGPVEASSASTATRSTSPTGRLRRRGPATADAVADAISTPSYRSSSARRPRRRGRRVTRIVRRIELWSVLKVALVFNTIMLGVVLGAVALLWGLANTTGLVDDLEGFLQDAGFEGFRFRGAQLFQQVAFIGAVGALATTVFIVLATALVNLISEITGGIRFTVIEEIVDDPRRPVGPPPALALPVVPALAPSTVPPPGHGPRPPAAARPAPSGEPRPAPPAPGPASSRPSAPTEAPVTDAGAAALRAALDAEGASSDGGERGATSRPAARSTTAPRKAAGARKAAGPQKGGAAAGKAGATAKKAAPRKKAASPKPAARRRPEA